MTTRSEIARWFDEGKEMGATHMIVKWDTFDGSYDADYPVYVMPDEDVHQKDNKNGDKTVEVYSYAKDRDEQLAAHRVWNWD